MLLAVIRSALGYPKFTMGTIIGTPEVRPSRSSCFRESSSQCSNAHIGYGPNYFTMFWTQLTYLFNRRVAKPLEHTITLSGEEPTSRYETFLSMWALKEDQLVIPRVTFIRWATTLPLATIESLRPTFILAWWVGLVVKLPSTFALEGQSPSDPRKPLHAFVTFWEAYTP